MVSQQFPDGHSDSYGYTGLGMRLTKGDPTGTYSYLVDGVSPASDVLTDGHTSFTPGIGIPSAMPQSGPIYRMGPLLVFPPAAKELFHTGGVLIQTTSRRPAGRAQAP